MDRGIKVLYIAGFGRNGSTILGDILGASDSLFHAGELNFVWERNLLHNRRCGCGAPFRECELWNEVFDAAFGGMEAVDSREMTRLNATPALALGTARTLLTGGAHQQRVFQDHLRRLYGAMLEVTGARVVVDSSKRPLYGYLLGATPGVDLYVVHLIRDPRASAYSWLRKKPQPDRAEAEAYMRRFNPLESSLRWDVWNAATEALLKRPGRYMRLRYEDFMEKPRESVGDILRMMGEEPAELPFVDERRVRLGTGHTVSGNPNRFRTGTVELRPDDEWVSRMAPKDRWLVVLLTSPLLARYGYRVSAGKGALRG